MTELKEERDSRKKSLARRITLITLAVLAVAGACVWYFHGKVPSGAVLGGLSGSLVEKENRIAISMSQTDSEGKALKYPIPKRLYIFREDGGLVIADYSDEKGYFVSYDPCDVYFVKGDKIYVCTTTQIDGSIRPRSRWKIEYRFHVRDGKPYIDDTYTGFDGSSGVTVTEDAITWDSFMKLVTEQTSK